MTDQETGAAPAATETQETVAPEAKATEQAEAPKPETEGGANGDEAAASQEDTQDDSQADGQPKKKGGFQKKIDKLTRENYEKELRLQQTQRELETLRKQSQPAETVPTEEPKLENYKTVEDWQKDHAKWAREEGKREAQKEFESKQKNEKYLSAVADLNAREDRAREKYPDYDQVTNQIGQIIMGNDTLKQYMLDSNLSHEVGYHLAKNPEKLLEITRMSPLNAMRELARLEDKVTAPPPPKPVTKAPEPIKPVGTSERAAFSYENASMDEFAKRRREERRKYKG